MSCRVTDAVVDVDTFGNTEVPIVESHYWCEGLKCEVRWV